MIHPPNTIQWKPGDLVLHDADAKRREMLMVVLGYGRDGRCKTRYLTPGPMNGGRRTIWRNPVMCLHDPERFGVK